MWSFIISFPKNWSVRHYFHSQPDLYTTYNKECRIQSSFLMKVEQTIAITHWSWHQIIGHLIPWSSGISLLDVMNIWLQPFTPQVFKVMPQDAWMPIPRVVTPNIHWYWFLVLGIRTPKHHTGDNTHWPTKLDTVDKTSVQRRFFGCNCAARFVLKSNWKKGEKRHIRARNMIFLGLIFSGPQSLVIKGGHWRIQRQ